MSERLLIYIEGLTPENWLQISKEIRADKEIDGFPKAQISVYNSRAWKEAMIVAEMIGRICRARSLSLIKTERPLYDLTQQPSPINLADLTPGLIRGPHGTQGAIERLLLRRHDSAHRWLDPGAVGRKGEGPGAEDRALEDRRRELRASQRYQQDRQTPADHPAAPEDDSAA